MIYRLLADLTVLVHFAYVMFVILALVAILLGWLMKWDWVRNRWFRGIHLAMILIVVFEAWAHITCPLTTLEKQLRAKAGQESYQGDFIASWVHDVLFFEDVEVGHWAFTAAYSLFGGLVLVTLFLVKPNWRTSRDLDTT